MAEIMYPELYDALVKEAESQGFHVKEVSEKKLRDYEAMNPEAAKALGYKMPAHEIEIQRDLTFQKKYRDLNHELLERTLMAKGWTYWEAHIYALDHERDISSHLFRMTFGTERDTEHIAKSPVSIRRPRKETARKAVSVR